MNRRISILYYWLARKNNVSIGELAGFLFNPRMPRIAARYIARGEEDGIYFHGKPLMARFWVPGTAGTAGGR